MMKGGRSTISLTTSICFVAHNAFGALAAQDKGHIGGIERQQALMACWLADHGVRTSMITWDEGQKNGACVNGVNVFKLCRRADGTPGIRFVYPRWTSLVNAMRRADADIYYYNCGDLGLGQVALWARLNRKKTVYSVASEPDCDPRLPTLKPWRERALYRYGLLHADSVLVQTVRQQEMLQAGFGIQSTRIPMPCAGFENGEGAGLSSGVVPHILWVGRFSVEKRLELLLDMAEACPDYIFDVVGAANAASPYARSLAERAAGIRNVVMHGRVVHKDLGSLYRQARLLCCTSSFEGFPNTFLEAWSIGLPIVSTFDPDNVIASRGLGVVASNVSNLRDGIETLILSHEKWQYASDCARAYFAENHTLDAVMPRFLDVFQEIVR